MSKSKIFDNFNKKDILNNIFLFIKNAFIKKTNKPIISILLFIVVVVLNSLQYANNDTYLQNKVMVSNRYYPEGTTNVNNVALYIFDMLGINAFINDTPAIIFYFMITYILLALVEMNIGYATLLFLLIIDVMFLAFWDPFQDAICKNDLYSLSGSMGNAPYCCGSFVLFMAFGFVLFITQKNIKNIYIRLFVLLIGVFVIFMCSLYDTYKTFSYMDDSPQKTCLQYTWHAANFVFGILCASILSN